MTADGRFAVSGSGDKTLRTWELAWDYAFPQPADWDDDARPHLEAFLTLSSPTGEDGISRIGKPQWSDEDFDGLIQQLQYSGHGWLKPEGVRRELEKMTAAWQGPSSLPGAS